MKHSFVCFPLKPFSGHPQKASKLTSFFALPKSLIFNNTTTQTPLSLTPKKLYSKDPRSFDRAYRSYPSHLQAWRLVSLTPSTLTSTSLTSPTTFADVRETSPTHKWFRAFIKTHSRHVALPLLSRSCRLRISSASPTISAFAFVQGLGLLLSVSRCSFRTFTD